MIAMWMSTPMRCPWCGERFEALIDGGEASGDYIEDCPVCCRPITMHLDVDGDAVRLDGGRDD